MKYSGVGKELFNESCSPSLALTMNKLKLGKYQRIGKFLNDFFVKSKRAAIEIKKYQ
jgi:hypothetical protein